MNTLILKTLRCDKENELIGGVKCRLELNLDGIPQPPLRQTLAAGQTWKLNLNVAFDSAVSIKLWSEETLGGQGLIGKTGPDFGQIGPVQIAFEGQGRFVLTGSISKGPDGQAHAESVEDALLQFQNSTRPGLWPNIPKAALIDDLRATTSKATLVDQGRTPLCGPASILFELARKNPRRYVQICQSLYETGQFQSRTHLVKPSATLMNSRVRSDVTLADWLLMSTLRDTENLFFPVEDTSSIFVMGFTKPWEMRGWTFDLLGYDTAEYQSLIFYGEFEAMKKAQDVVNRGGVVFMMIQSALLGNPKPFISYPDHWITFTGNLNIEDGIWNRQKGHILFDCYTWGGTRTIKSDDKSFEDYTWGLVYGIP